MYRTLRARWPRVFGPVELLLRPVRRVGTVTARIRRYQDWGARVCLFMDPDPEQIARAKDCGADRIELYTGPYAAVVAELGPDHAETQRLWAQYRDAANAATALGLGVNAGHDLDTENLPLFMQIPDILEVSIGHALIKDALYLGLTATIHAYLSALETSKS